jgi:hypothetical protein
VGIEVLTDLQNNVVDFFVWFTFRGKFLPASATTGDDTRAVDTDVIEMQVSGLVCHHPPRG